MTFKNLTDIIKALYNFKTENKQKAYSIIGSFDKNTQAIYNSLNAIVTSFSSGGFKSGIKSFSSSISSLIAAHPVLTTLGVTLASFAAADKWVYDADDKLNAASEAIGNYQETLSEIESVNSELDETKTRIDELNAKQTLSLVEQNELDKLERSNAELERRQKILDNLKSSQLETAKNSMADYLNNKTTKDYSYKIYNPTTWNGYKNQMIVSSNEDLNYEYQDIEATPLEGIESHLNAIKELQDEITQLEQEQTGLSNENDIQKLQKQINSKKSLMEDYKTFVSDNLGKISDETETFDAYYFDSDNYNQIQDILNQWDEILGTTGSRIETKLNGIFEIEALKNTDIKQTLVEYVKPLKDISEFNLDNINVDGIIRLKTALSNANISAEDLYNYLKAIADDGVYDLEEVAKQLKESTTKAILDSDSKADKKITEWTVDNWVNSLSDEELNISAKIKADPEIDTSQWDMETWERQIQNKLNEGIKNITIDSVTKDFSESVDNIQSAYSTLSNAVSEYNKYGAYSLDTLQSLLSLEPQYLAMLVNENGQLGINRTALIDLINTQVEEAKSKLYQAEINEINSLSVSNESGTIDDNTQKYKDNTDAINNNTTAKALNDAISSAKNRGVSQEDIDAIQNKYKTYFDNLNNLQNNIKNNTADILKGFDNSGKSASDAADKIKDIQRQIDDLAKSEALDKLKYKFDSLEQSITKIDNKISLLNDISDLTSEDDYIGKSEIVTQQLELTKSKTNLLVDEFKKLQNEEYNSADSASELASRMKSVADSINENQKQIVEYGKNVSSCYMSALTSISSLSKDSISMATTLIDRNIKSLSEGSLTGLQFNITPTIPQSAVEKQRKENTTLLNDMSSYYDSVAEMQKIALDLQYQEQMDDNTRKKEELIKSLNEQKQALNDYFVDIEDTQKAHDNTTTQEMSTDLTNKTIQIQTFTDTVKDTISELLNWLQNNPITQTLKGEVIEYADQAEKSAEAALNTLEDLKDAVINIHNNTDGNLILVSDCSDKKIDELNIYGRSSQDGTPTITVPIDITNTFDSLTTSVFVTNKNLLSTSYTKDNPLTLTADKDDYNEYNPHYPFYIIEGQTYTFSFESDGDVGGTSGTDTVQAGLLDVTNGIHYMTTENKYLAFTAKKTGKCSFRCDVNKNGCTHSFWNFQVEVGDVKTEYVEGNTQSIEIALSEPLRCIPVKSGGNYTNDMGQQYLADVICQKDSQIGVLRYVNYVRLTSSGFTLFKEYDSGDKISFQKSLGSNYYNESGLCTHFEFSHSYNINTMWLADSRIIVTVSDDYTLNTFKTFLDENEVYLAVTCSNNPTFEAFDEDTQSKIKSLATYYGITNAYNNEGAYIKLNYVADTKLYIDNKFNELAKAITATESEV